MKKNFRRLAHSLFGRYFRKRKEEFRSLQQNLTSARINISIDQWLSMTVFASLLTTLSSIPLLYVILVAIGVPEVTRFVTAAGIVTILTVIYVFFLYGKYRPKGEIRLEDELTGEKYILNKLILVILIVIGATLLFVYPGVLSIIVNKLRSIFFLMKSHIVLLFVAFIPLVFFAITWIIFNLYPRVATRQRRRNINGLMGPAIGLIGSVTGVGLTPYDSMKFLAEEKAYEEMSEEMEYLVRDVDLFGMDLISALRKLSKETASERLKLFLQGAVTTVTSGGNLREYLEVKSEECGRKVEKKLDEYVDFLSLIAEIFLVAGVVAPALIIVVLAVMSMMGEVPISMLYAMLTIVPAVTFLVVMMTDFLEPPSAE